MLLVTRSFKNHHRRFRGLNELANFHCNEVFNFCYATEEEVRKEILNLSSKKATRIGDIPVKELKTNINIYLKELTPLVNDCIEKGVFPYKLKLADVSHVFKKGESLNKENYIPVIIISYMSKVFERIFYKIFTFSLLF